MPKLENIDAPSVLGITEQQLNLLKTVYKLTSKNKTATPREIEHTYRADHNTQIQTSNLFRQLKTLLDKQFLTRENEADYRLNIEGIKKTLDTRKQEYHTKLEHYEQLTNQLEEYFKKATETKGQPVVEYLTDKELFFNVSQSLKKADKYYTTSKFPGVAYTYTLYTKIGRGEYSQILQQRCFEKKDIEVWYLTPLDLDYPFTHSMAFYRDKEKALKECEIIITQLENLAETYDNLHIFHLENPYGLDVMLPEGKDLIDSYLFLRDEHMNATGGIYMKSPEIAKRAKETFFSLCSNALEVRGEQGKIIYNKLRGHLKRLGK